VDDHRRAALAKVAADDPAESLDARRRQAGTVPLDEADPSRYTRDRDFRRYKGIEARDPFA
jgi:hypothetical protein